jgi:hypothetical protein
MSVEIQSHRDLDVYRKAFAAAMQVFELSKKFPKERLTRSGYLRPDQAGALLEAYDEVLRMIVGMINHPENWETEQRRP